MNKSVKGQYLRDLSVLTQACSTFKTEMVESNEDDLQRILKVLLENHENLENNPPADYLISSLQAASRFLDSRRLLVVTALKAP